MAYKKMCLALLLMAAVGCSVNKNISNDVQFGKSATSEDLSYIHKHWSTIKNKIAVFDRRSCVNDNLDLEDLEFISVEGLNRLSISASDFQHNLNGKDVKKIYGLEFRDPCGYEASPAWIVVDTVSGFTVIDFILIEE